MAHVVEDEVLTEIRLRLTAMSAEIDKINALVERQQVNNKCVDVADIRD